MRWRRQQTALGLEEGDAESALKRTVACRQLAMVDFAKIVLPTEAEIQAVLQAAVVLVAAIHAERQAFVFRSLAWLVKLGVLKAG